MVQNGLFDNYCWYHHTGAFLLSSFSYITFELDKILPLHHTSDLSNVTQDSSGKITLEKSIVMYFLVNFDALTYLLLWYIFTDHNSYSILYLLSFLVASIPAFSTIWDQVKSDCFSITRFGLCSYWGRKLLKPFHLRRAINFVIFSKAFFNAWWFLPSTLDISKLDIPTLTTFIIFYFLALVKSFSLLMFQYMRTNRK